MDKHTVNEMSLSLLLCRIGVTSYITTHFSKQSCLFFTRKEAEEDKLLVPGHTARGST